MVRLRSRSSTCPLNLEDDTTYYKNVGMYHLGICRHVPQALEKRNFLLALGPTHPPI